MFGLMSFLLIIPALTAPAPLAEVPTKGDIPRWGVVADGVYRGGQPTEKGFQFLKEKGIKTIVNLRAEDNSEAKLVEKLGMNYIQIPIPEVRPWSQIPN